jgi:ribonuclease HII
MGINMSMTIGCDEVGRGPIAGPVVGCAVRINVDLKTESTLRNLGVTDSKKLSHKKRVTILDLLKIESLKLNEVVSITFDDIKFDFCIMSCSETVIDEINILQASLLAMKNACLKMNPINERILIDGNKVFEIPGFKGSIDSLVKGDSKDVAIGLASIIAKEFRDNLMIDLSKKYPGYGLEKHAGYPTVFHKNAVKELGASPIHRKSFRGVKEYILE